MPPFLRNVLTLCGSAIVAAVIVIGSSHVWLPQTMSDGVIRDYLLRHPEVVADAIQALQEKSSTVSSKAAIAAHRDDIYHDRRSIAGANINGDVTLVEFFDYRCPYCKQVFPALRDAINQDGRIRLIYKELPILGPDSVLASRFAIAAALHQPDKYAAFHDALMQTRGTLTEASILEVAQESGLDVPALKASVQDAEIDQVIEANLQLAETLGINGTPAFVIGDDMVLGAISADRLRDLIAAARSKS